jgi:hypothetical protein
MNIFLGGCVVFIALLTWCCCKSAGDSDERMGMK